ncbi:MAG: hypothetical protein QG561_483 [Patescibacteria group bacterium]|nr:hypothetical protein [Patescibacteria group bacterium]
MDEYDVLDISSGVSQGNKYGIDYFLRRSRISVKSSISLGHSGSVFFFGVALLIALTRRKMQNAIIKKLKSICRKFP